MIVVSDTTALTTLMKSGLEGMLPALFGEVLIPEAVAQELLCYHPVLPGWCSIDAVEESPLLASLRLAVDAGEAEVIALALDLHASIVLLDDKKDADGQRHWVSPVWRCRPSWSQRSAMD